MSEAVRIEMLRLMCKDKPRLEISEEEILVPGRVTSDTMPILQKQHPEAELFFLAGADKLNLITLWAENCGDFLKQFRVALVCRDGTVPKQIIDEHPILQSYRDSFQFVTQPAGSEEIRSTVIQQAESEEQPSRVEGKIRRTTNNNIPIFPRFSIDASLVLATL